eukprot:9536736-Prorocentrum_lima.AAC.1
METSKGQVVAPSATDADGVPFDEGALREAIRKASQLLAPTKTHTKTQSQSTQQPTQPEADGAD